jgi:hypothetical protein
VGHYENGDTLVVDTIGVLVHRYNFVDNYRTPHTDQLHVVERYRLSADGKTIDVNVRFEDPAPSRRPGRRGSITRSPKKGPLEENDLRRERGSRNGPLQLGLTHAAELAPMPQDDTPDF